MGFVTRSEHTLIRRIRGRPRGFTKASNLCVHSPKHVYRLARPLTSSEQIPSTSFGSQACIQSGL